MSEQEGALSAGRVWSELMNFPSEKRVAQLLVVDDATLRSWRTKGLITPEVKKHGRRPEYTYNMKQITRVFAIKSLRSEGYSFGMIRQNLRNPDLFNTIGNDFRDFILSHDRNEE